MLSAKQGAQVSCMLRDGGRERERTLAPLGRLGLMVVAVALSNTTVLGNESTPSAPALRTATPMPKRTFFPAPVSPRASRRLWTGSQIQLMRASRRIALCEGSTRMTSKYL